MQLKGYLGNEKAVVLMRNYMDAWLANRPFAKCVILHGPPGVGKSYLLPALARTYRTPLVRHNLSRDRGLARIEALKRSSTTQSLSGGLKLIFLDESDYMTKGSEKAIIDLIKETKSPLVMACNYIQKIPLYIRKMCLEVELEKPTPADLVKYAADLYADNPEVNIYQFRDLIVKCRSYRQVKHAIENGTIVHDADSYIEDEGSMVEALFRGVDLGLKAHHGERLLMWVRDNTTTPEVPEVADYMFAMNRRVGRPIGEQACSVLSLATGSEARFPWSLKARAAPKKKPKAKTESKKLPTRGRGALKLAAGSKTLDSMF